MRLHRVHQNIILNGKDMGEQGNRRHSKFFNEGKWQNFIAPLLPTDCTDMTFIEFGCNAGLFLHLARTRGFRDVIGIEADPNACRVAEAYRKSIGLDYKIINELITEDYDVSKLPAADIVLFSNLHYHLRMAEFINLLDALRYKACACIVVSIHKNRSQHWLADHSMDSIRRYFKEWHEADCITDVPMAEDPHPRDMYSIKFESGLQRLPIDELRFMSDERGDGATEIDFIEKALRYRGFNTQQTRYYQRVLHKPTLKLGDPATLEQRALEFADTKKLLARDIRDNGMRRPVYITPDKRVFDGGHRLRVMQVLGYKSIITRTI